MIAYGIWFASPGGISGNALYDHTVTAFKWTVLAGGACLLVVSVLCGLGWRIGLLADAVLSFALAGLFVGVAAVYVSKQDYEGVLILVFGVMFFLSGRRSLGEYRVVVGATAGTKPAKSAKPSPKPSLQTAPAKPQQQDQPRPQPVVKPSPEGFLAELGRENKKQEQ